MKNLTDFINEAHYPYTLPHDEKGYKQELDTYTRDYNDSQKKQKELEAELKRAEQKLGSDNGVYDNAIQVNIDSLRYRIAMEEAEQLYNQKMINVIKEIIKNS